MPDIFELGRRRAELQERVNLLGVLNTPVDYAERIKADVAMRIAIDALMRAERDYNDAINRMTAEELSHIALAPLPT